MEEKQHLKDGLTTSVQRDAVETSANAEHWIRTGLPLKSRRKPTGATRVWDGMRRNNLVGKNIPCIWKLRNQQEVAGTIHLFVDNRLIVGECDCQHRNLFIARIFAILWFLDAELRFSRLETHKKSALRFDGNRKCSSDDAPESIFRHHLSPNGIGQQKIRTRWNGNSRIDAAEPRGSQKDHAAGCDDRRPFACLFCMAAGTGSSHRIGPRIDSIDPLPTENCPRRITMKEEGQ